MKRIDLALIVLGVSLIIIGQFTMFYTEPARHWIIKDITPLGFEIEEYIVEMGCPLRDFGLMIFGLGFILLCMGILVSLKILKFKSS